MGALGDKDIWFATRDVSSVSFGAPQLVPDLNTAGAESELHLSADRCELFFGRQGEGLVSYDLFQTRLSVD